jgi:prevent-host-death family protein
MQVLALSALRADISSMIDLVQQGETVRILRHGKPVADLVPVQEVPLSRQPSWKQPFEPVALPPEASLAQAVLHEREVGA